MIEKIPKIIFEDNHLLVISKPAGLLAQANAPSSTQKASEDVLSVMKSFIKKRDKKPGNVFLGLVHRLDRNTSGIMVLAKTSKAASRLSEQIRERKIRKHYVALVHGVPNPRKGTVESSIEKDHARNRSVVSEKGRKAATTYRVIRTYRKPMKCSLLEVEILTGRSHQIRVHMQSINNPLIGDKKYNKIHDIVDFNRPALHASRIEFFHPVKKESIVFEADLAGDMKQLLKTFV